MPAKFLPPNLLGNNKSAGSISGGGAFSPEDLSGLTIWLKSDAITGLSDDDPVTTWEDQSGNANDFTQSTASKKPTYKTSIQNSLPAVRFDGTDDGMLISSIALNTDFTLYMALDAGATNDVIIEHSANASSNDGFYVISSNNQTVRVFRGGVNDFFNDDVSDWLDTATGDWSYICLSYDSSTDLFTIRRNGADRSGTQGTENPVNTAATDQLNLGSRNQASSFFLGDIGEVIFYNNVVHNTTQIQSVEEYLADKWNIA